MNDCFEINKAKVRSYFYWCDFVVIICCSIPLWATIIAIPIALALAFAVAPNLSERQANALKYWLEKTNIRIEQGVYFL